jgi:hypothetical protein
MTDFKLSIKEQREARAQVFCIIFIILGLCILIPIAISIIIVCIPFAAFFFVYWYCIFYAGDKLYEYYINR